MLPLLFISLAFGIEIGNGLVKTPIGSAYLYNDISEQFFRLHRKAPSVNPLQLENAQPISRKRCSQSPRDAILLGLPNFIETEWARNLKSIRETSSDLGYDLEHSERHRRSDLMAAATIFGGLVEVAKLAKSFFTGRKSKNLEEITLSNKKSIDILVQSLEKTQSYIEVANSEMSADIGHLASEICRVDNYVANNILKIKAQKIVEDEILKIEQEVVSLMTGQVPLSLDYLHLFSASCKKACSEIIEYECDLFCKNLIRHTPEALGPELLGLSFSNDEILIDLKFNIPIITSEKFEALQIKSIGLIRNIDGKFYHESPILKPFGIKMANQSYELDTNSCHEGREIFICKTDAVIGNSCLQNVATCDIRTTESSVTCTWAQSRFGTIIFAEQDVVVTYKNKIDRFEHKIMSFTGFKVIKPSSEPMIATCSGPVPEVIDIIRGSEIERSEITIQQDVDLDFESRELNLEEIERNTSISKITNEIKVIESNIDQIDSQIFIQIITYSSLSAFLFFLFFFLAYCGIRRLNTTTVKIKTQLNDLKPLL